MLELWQTEWCPASRRVRQRLTELGVDYLLVAKVRWAKDATGAAHVDCAKECILHKDAAVGILSDGDGLFKIWGAMTRDKHAKLLPFIGQTVEVTGTEVTVSNNYDARSFDLQTVKRKGK